jgi:hypothetical protein
MNDNRHLHMQTVTDKAPQGNGRVVFTVSVGSPPTYAATDQPCSPLIDEESIGQK